VNRATGSSPDARGGFRRAGVAWVHFDDSVVVGVGDQGVAIGQTAGERGPADGSVVCERRHDATVARLPSGWLIPAALRSVQLK